MIKSKVKIALLLCLLCGIPSYATSFQDALRNNTDSSKNIYSKNTIIQSELNANIDDTLYKETVIKHKLAINDLDDIKCEIIEDENVHRIMIKMFLDNCVLYAKDGFYRLNSKIYYFDSEGHMVLGPCVDREGNRYFFSYETGELVED